MKISENIVISGDYSGLAIGICDSGLAICDTNVFINRKTIINYFVLEDESETGSDFANDFSLVGAKL